MQHKLCVNCLVSPHSLKNCSSSHKCRVCRLPHHTTLHFDKNMPFSTSGANNSQNSASTPTTMSPSFENDQSHTFVANTQCVTNTLSIPQHTILLSTCQSQPTFKFDNDCEVAKEERQIVLNVSLPNDNFILSLLNRFWSLPKIQRIVGFILRFIFNLSQE